MNLFLSFVYEIHYGTFSCKIVNASFNFDPSLDIQSNLIKSQSNRHNGRAIKDLPRKWFVQKSFFRKSYTMFVQIKIPGAKSFLSKGSNELIKTYTWFLTIICTQSLSTAEISLVIDDQHYKQFWLIGLLIPLCSSWLNDSVIQVVN